LVAAGNSHLVLLLPLCVRLKVLKGTPEARSHPPAQSFLLSAAEPVASLWTLPTCTSGNMQQHKCWFKDNIKTSASSGTSIVAARDMFVIAAAAAAAAAVALLLLVVAAVVLSDSDLGGRRSNVPTCSEILHRISVHRPRNAPPSNLPPPTSAPGPGLPPQRLHRDSAMERALR
jgi:hypothetical protein